MNSAQHTIVLEIARRRAENPPRPLEPLQPGERLFEPLAFRPVRRGQRIWQWEGKIYFRMPSAVKTWFCERARRYAMSQAELGLALLEGVQSKPVLLAEFVREYRRRQREAGYPRPIVWTKAA